MLQVEIITPEQKLPLCQAEHVTLPAFDGEVGIRRGHAAFICQLGDGLLHVKNGDEDQQYQVSGGVAQVERDVVRVLAEWVEAVAAGEVD
jgi:F-type H+-transporting ATPase subunit epsilon